MPTVETDADAFMSLSDLRSRVPYDGTELYTDNTQLRFDELLVTLERESRGIFETLWGDEPVTSESGRVDEIRSTDDAALLLAYPVQDVTQVEVKRAQSSEWDTLDVDRWGFTDHRLILEGRRQGTQHRRTNRRNRLTDLASRATWRDVATKVRVTYDRGWSEVPEDIKSIQAALVIRILRKHRMEDGFAAASPSDFQGVAQGFDDVVTAELRQRIADVTNPGGATMSI